MELCDANKFVLMYYLKNGGIQSHDCKLYGLSCKDPCETFFNILILEWLTLEFLFLKQPRNI